MLLIAGEEKRLFFSSLYTWLRGKSIAAWQYFAKNTL
jgi:hypothetical protein